MPWLRENGASFDICNSILSIDDNLTIPFKELPAIIEIYQLKDEVRMLLCMKMKIRKTRRRESLVIL
jgi:hypothetical protein